MKQETDWLGVVVIAFMLLAMAMFLCWGIENWIGLFQGVQP